jgi:hypothetical protein
MKPVSRAMLLIALFLAVDVTVYLVAAHEYTGGLLIAATSISFAFLGYILQGATRRASRELAQDPSAEVGGVELEHVGPTIWPVGFSIAAVVLALGSVTLPWLLVPGGILFVASALGWFLDVRHQHEAHQGPSEDISHEPTAPPS